MPTYGYQCKECNHTFEVIQKMSDKPLEECEKCKGKIRRLIYPVGIAFKGSGFHINDYKKPGSSDSVPSTPKPEVKAPETKTKDTVEAK